MLSFLKYKTTFSNKQVMKEFAVYVILCCAIAFILSLIVEFYFIKEKKDISEYNKKTSFGGYRLEYMCWGSAIAITLIIFLLKNL